MARSLRMALVSLSALVWGCHGGGAPTMPTWATIEQPYTPVAGSSNAFDGYALAALEAEQAAPKQLLMVSFSPDKREMAIKLTAKALQMVRQTAGRKCTFQFRARPPFTSAPYQTGWRLLGRSLVWSIQSAAKAGQYDRAIADAILGTKFGFDLTSGGATDASLGLVIANDSRKALMPYLDKMDSSQFGKLAAGMKRALSDKPLLDTVIDNEHKNMLLAVQYIQDAYRTDNYKDLEANTGADGRTAVSYLRDLKPEDAKKRPAYFEGFAKEADAVVASLKTASRQPASRRPEKIIDPGAQERPWRRFAKNFFRAPEPLLTMNDETLARTRILILTAELRRQAKLKQALPKSLTNFTPSLTLDPFSGKPLIYHCEGPDFTLYSVGSNYQDDGGDTDESFASPDLLLEHE